MKLTKGFTVRVMTSGLVFSATFGWLLGTWPQAVLLGLLTGVAWNLLGEVMFAYHGDDDA